MKVSDWRNKISDLWHAEVASWQYAENFGFETNDRYWAFCAAKDWIQDTGEALVVHRRRGFSDDPFLAYLEFWGILQAVVVQQDAIAGLQYAFRGSDEKILKTEGTAWKKLRDLRNLAVGHPTDKRASGNSVMRCVSGREGKSYERIPLRI
jgi:hypothetical protein